MMQSSHYNRSQQVNEHDAPTEPLQLQDLAFFPNMQPPDRNVHPSQYPPQPFPGPYGQSAPAQPPYIAPTGASANQYTYGPTSAPGYQQVPPGQYGQGGVMPSPYNAQGNSYPFLPPSPYAGSMQNAGGVAQQQRAQGTLRIYWWQGIPALIGFFAVLLQLLLLVRFAVRALQLGADFPWVGIVSTISDVFISPFRMLWTEFVPIQNMIPTNVEVYTLVAILIYGVGSRLLVRLLKALLRTPR